MSASRLNCPPPLLLVLAMLLLAPPAAPAQADSLPSELITKAGALTSSETSRIAAYVEAHVQQLTSDDPAARQRARRALREPVIDDSVSVSFRIEYGKAARAPLARVVREGDAQARLLALHIAGQIATEPCARIAADTLDSADPIARYSAAYALGLTNTIIAQREPAITPQQALELNNRLGDRLDQEQDMWVLDRVIRSLGAASDIPQPRFDAVATSALDMLARGLGNRLDAPSNNNPHQDSPIELEIVLRGANLIQSAFQRGQRLPEQTVRLAAGFGGDCLAHVARTVKADHLAVQHEPLLKQLAVIGENIAFFARGSHPDNPEPKPVRNLQIAPTLTQDNDVPGFLDALEQLIGQDGILTRAPFGFPPERFAF